MTSDRELMQQALKYTKPGAIVPVTPETVKILVDALRLAIEQAERQEPVAWMGTDIEGNPNKFRLNFFGGAIPLFALPEDESLIATNEKSLQL
jgi:hypothetical protein